LFVQVIVENVITCFFEDTVYMVAVANNDRSCQVNNGSIALSCARIKTTTHKELAYCVL